MSDHLKAFLSAWLEWVESGAPEGDVFERFSGLCSNFRWYVQTNGVSMGDSEDAAIYLQDIFKSEGLDENYPFGGQEIYEHESSVDESHLNEERLAWVRAKVEQFAAA